LSRRYRPHEQRDIFASMPTPRSFWYEYPADADALAALLRDPAFLRWRAESAGDKNVEITIEQAESGLRVTVARDREVALPAFAKRMFQTKNRVVDETLWKRSGDKWIGDYEIQIPGIPGEVKGQVSLVPCPEGCRYEAAFQVTSKVPMLGSKLESFVADRVEESLRANAERNAQYLAS
jgi:hypothetical protein